jgi:hypothetical protein
MVSKMLRFRKLFLLILFLAAWSLLSVGCGGDADFFELPEDDDVFELPEDDDVFELPGDEDGANGVSPPQAETISGSGSDVVPFTVGTSGAVTFQLVHSGDGAFIVYLLDASAERVTLLTAKNGDVSDTRVENLAAGSYLLDIDSTGEWSVSITDSAVSMAGSSVSVAGSAGGDTEAATPLDSWPETLPLITFAAPGQTLSVPLADFRNVALVLDPERGPAPAGGLPINYLLVDDPGLIQKIGMAEKLDSDPVEGGSSIEGVVEVNNAESITIPGGDFAVTFQVQARNPGTALLILVGGHGYVPPTWPDSLGTLTIVVPDE